MGFNNDGVQVVAERLKKWRTKFEVQSSRFEVEGQHKSHITHHTLIIGGNIGKNKSTPNEEAWKDYETCFLALHDQVDYFVVNVSSPNTPGLRELQEKDSLRKILTNLQTLNGKYTAPKPILLKIAPDLTTEQVDDVIELALEIKLDGLVASNTTISRDHLQTSPKESGVLRTNIKPACPIGRLQTIGAGGLSGLPLKNRSTELVRYIHEKTNGQIPIIASGGIFTGADAKEKFDAGASLVQVWTGFVYEGPSIVKNISTYLANNK
jgi:dihydroorotate dehydrogenase